MSAVSIQANLCDGCGACLQSCPTDVFARSSDGKVTVRYGRDCHVCFLCQDDCPQGAINVDHKIKNPRARSIYEILNMAIDMPPTGAAPR
jgi:NAD-dependent dihydropyrimidine dehydrogenase PreA subunit